MTTMEEKKEDEYEEEESFLLFIAREVEESEETAHTNTLVTARTSANTKEKKSKIKKSNIWYAPHPQQQLTPARWEEVEKRKRENEDKSV